MRISIIGAGNGGQAMAGHFALLGHEITLYNRSLAKLQDVVTSKEICLYECIEGKSKILKVTDILQEAIDGADLIMITVTANAHRDIAHMIAPYISNGQIIVLNPGRTLGALEFSNIIKAHTDTPFFIAEAQSLIYACRIESPGNVKIIGVKNKVLLSAFPSKDTKYVLDIVNKIFPCFIKAENCLRTSLENIGAIFHPAVMIFNAATIERGNLFYFYNDMTPTIANFLTQIDQERIEIGKAFGIELLSVLDWVSYAYEGINGNNLCEKMRNNPAYHKILAPNTLHSRLLLEDIPTGILPFVELATLAKVETPLMNSILNISSSLLGIDFKILGRTLKNLGLEGKDLTYIMKML